jgi:hypothetical protein
LIGKEMIMQEEALCKPMEVSLTGSRGSEKFKSCQEDVLFLLKEIHSRGNTMQAHGSFFDRKQRIREVQILSGGCSLFIERNSVGK